MKISALPYMLAGATGAVIASTIPYFIGSSFADTRLLPFQGRLTDASGSAIPDGAKIVEFKMYDAPTGGTAKWAGEVHKLSVNGGLVNTMLGSKSSLRNVDFSTSTFLQITIDANGDGQITAADPPLMPRQSVVSALYAVEAGNSRSLAGHDWSSILKDGSNDPATGLILGARLEADGLTKDQIGTAAIESDEIADGVITRADLSADVLNAIVPAGTIVPFAGQHLKKDGASNIPAGWLLCDGRALNSDGEAGKYKLLFDAIGQSWGDGTEHQWPAVPEGDPNTNFNLPDLRGYFLRGVDHGAGRDLDAGNRIAPKLHGQAINDSAGSVQEEQLKQHFHNTINNSSVGLNASLDIETTKYIAKRAFRNSHSENYNLSGTSALPNLGASSPFGGNETRPKNAYVNYIIKY